jgi:hypothetical protein
MFQIVKITFYILSMLFIGVLNGKMYRELKYYFKHPMEYSLSLEYQLIILSLLTILYDLGYIYVLMQVTEGGF